LGVSKKLRVEVTWKGSGDVKIAEIADVCGKTELDMLMSQGSWRLVALVMIEKMATSSNSNETLPAHQSFDSASFFSNQDMAQRSLP